MLFGARTTAAIGLALTFPGCANFQVIQDPRVGALSSDRIAELVHSVKCELATFYSADFVHRQKLSGHRAWLARQGERFIPIQYVLENYYFDLDTDAYGSFTLDIKIQDSLSLPGTPTSITNVLNGTTGRTRSLGIGPSVQAQATYDNALLFAIPQNASIRTLKEIHPPEARALPSPFGGQRPPGHLLCYDHSVIGDYDGLAAGQYPNRELFDRIRVDGGLPLAGWLQGAGRTPGISRNILTDAHFESEGRKVRIPVIKSVVDQAIDTGQLTFNFMVQYTGGVDAKFSLMSSRFNPLVADISGGIQQTGTLTIAVNGYQALSAIGAKAGLVEISPRPSKPTRVIIVEDDRAPKPKTLSNAERSSIKTFTQQFSPTAGLIPPEKLDDLMKQLEKDQAATGQALDTRKAIEGLGVNKDAQKKIEEAIREKTAAPRTRTRIIEVPAQAPVGSNDGRGYLRYPLTLPAQ